MRNPILRLDLRPFWAIAIACGGMLPAAWAQTSGVACEHRTKTGEWPFAILRNYGSFKGNERFDERIFAAQKRHPGLFDEIWFGASDNIFDDPCGAARATLEMNSGARERCRELGIRYAIQGVSIGHDPDDLKREGFPEDAWIVDRTGKTRYGVLCCTSPFAATNVYERTKALLATVRPDAYWPDDDLRLTWKCGSCPAVCFCDRCIRIFNSRFGRRLDRKSLLAALDGGEGACEIRRDWCEFDGEALGRIAKVIARARDEVSPETRLGIQYCSSDLSYDGESWRTIITALAGKAGKAGIRPGGGYYGDFTLHNELPRKMVKVARETERCGRLPETRQMCYEVENWPHVAAQKNPNSMMMECACALAAGCDSIAFYWGADQNGEEDATYDYWFDMVAAWRPYHLAVRDAFRGTSIGGVAAYLGEDRFAGAGSEWTRLDEQEIKTLVRDGVPVGVTEGMPDAFWLSARGVRSLGTNDLSRVFSRTVLTDAWAFDRLAKRFPRLAFTRKVRIGALPKERALATAVRSAGYERFPSGLKCENVKALIYPEGKDVVVLSEMTADMKACGTCIVPTEFGGKVIVAQDVPAHAPHGAWPGCRRHAILDALDATVPGGMPVRILTEGYAVSVTVRKTADGRVAGVFLVNYGSGEMPPLRLAIRRGASFAWSVVRPKLLDLAAETVSASSSEVVLRIPAMAAFESVLVRPVKSQD